MITPGTRLEWANLGEWVDVAYGLHVPHRRACRRTYEMQDAHWSALTDERVLRSSEPELVRFLALLEGQDGPWSKPRRGFRGGTQWERQRVHAFNRLWKIRRDADWDSIPTGHNSQGGNACAASQ